MLLMMVTDVKFPKVTFTSLEKCGSAMIKYGLITQRTTNTSTPGKVIAVGAETLKLH